MRRRDRADDGMSRRECIDMLQDLQPALSRKQAEGAFDRNVRLEHKDKLTGVIKAEATSSKHSQITVPQQFRWLAPAARAASASAASPKKFWLLRYQYSDDVLERRGPFRERHICAAQAACDDGR